MEEFTGIFENNENFKPLSDAIKAIMEFPEDALDDNTVDQLLGMIQGSITSKVRADTIASLTEDFESQNLSKNQVKRMVDEIKKEYYKYFDILKPSQYKKVLLKGLFNIIDEIYDMTLDNYHNANVSLPMTLTADAQIPSYAHEEDAAADLYAAETVTLPAHSLSNKIATGIKIALPEGWMAIIVPRSSIGAKTGLRLSNSIGIIDNLYRGELGVLYDNISDSDYTINKGDRIAQLLIMHSYQFKPQVVDTLDETTRNEGGFGSTGV